MLDVNEEPTVKEDIEYTVGNKKRIITVKKTDDEYGMFEVVGKDIPDFGRYTSMAEARNAVKLWTEKQTNG